MEWIATVGVLVGIFVAGAKGMAWLRRKVAVAKQRRVRERDLDSIGELERRSWLLADAGASPRAIAEALTVRRSAVRRVLRDWRTG